MREQLRFLRKEKNGLNKNEKNKMISDKGLNKKRKERRPKKRVNNKKE